MAIKYIKSFDGLRGFGALMILMYHWPCKNFAISHGWEFMQMFFVLSGYLITLVLLEEKKKYSFKKFAGRFYIKRSLRLFPLYYAYLLSALAIYLFTKYSGITDQPMAREVYRHGIYLFTYTFNLMNIFNFWLGLDYNSHAWSTHLWTLSMEEQFYLVFPFLVFFFSVKQMRRMVIGAIIGAFFFRILSYQWYIKVNPGDEFWIVRNLVRIPFSQMDSFAFGAVVALFPLNFIKNAKRWVIATTAFVLGVYLINMGYVYFIQGETYYHLTYGKKLAEGWMAHNYLFVYIITLVNLWCAVLIVYLKRTTKSIWFFENKPIMFIGKLSYGIYLLHLPFLYVFFRLMRKYFTMDYINTHWYVELVMLILFMAFTIFVSYYVNKYFESYFIRLKNRIVKREKRVDTTSSFPRSFDAPLNAIAINDKWGSISYSNLNLLIQKHKEQFKKEEIIGKRVCVKGVNSRHLIAVMCGLLDLNNEVVMQEPKSTNAEDDTLLNLYNINVLISINNQECSVLKKTDHTHNIVEPKLYYLSSGSTGQPKVFSYSISKFCSQLNNWTKHIGQTNQDVVLCPLSITHFHGAIVTFSSLFVGNQVIFLDDNGLNTTDIKKVLNKYKPHIITGVPYLYQRLLEDLEEDFKGFERIKRAICGSAPMSAELAEKYFAKFGFYLNQGYGLSEIGAICIDLKPELGVGTVGKVIDQISYRIVDENGDGVTQGAEGELVVQAPFMVDGYLEQPELSSEMFIDGWLHTKDIVKEDNLGRLVILGRKSSFVNVAGNKVYPEEIEKLIQSEFPKLRIAVKKIESEVRNGLAIYLEGNDKVELEEIKKYCNESLVKYKRPVEYNIVNFLPENQIGKIVYTKIGEN